MHDPWAWTKVWGMPEGWGVLDGRGERGELGTTVNSISNEIN